MRQDERKLRWERLFEENETQDPIVERTNWEIGTTVDSVRWWRFSSFGMQRIVEIFTELDQKYGTRIM